MKIIKFYVKKKLIYLHFNPRKPALRNSFQICHDKAVDETFL